MSKAPKNSPGFTLVELMVAIPMVIVVIGIVVGLMIALVGNVIASNSKNQMIYEVQTALNQIEQDAFLSTSFVDTYSAPSPQMKNDSSGTYDATPAAGTMPDIVLNQLGTTKNPMDPTRAISYYARPNPCSGEQAANDPFFIKVVYFVKAGTLYKRTIVPLNNTNATPDGDTVCAKPWQRGSCTSGYAANARCQTKDTKMLNGVDSVNVTYFNKQSPTVPLADAGVADSMRITISLKRNASGDTYSHTGSLSATRTNSLPTAAASLTTPVISLSGDYPPGGAIFTWWPVPNASSYDVKYSINNGSTWSAVKNVPASQTELKYNTVEATSVQDIFGGESVKVSVTAKNELGSQESVATFAIPVWKPCGPMAPVANYGNDGIQWAEMAYTYTQGGVVMVRGRVTDTATNATVCILPEGYRPDRHLRFRAFSSNKANISELHTDGRVNSYYADNSWHTFDNIAFIPAGTSYSWTNFTNFQNGWDVWTQAGTDPYVSPRYVVDSMGRTHIQMIVKPGTVSDGGTISSINNSSIAQGPQVQHLIAATDNSSAGYNVGIGLGISGTNRLIQTKNNAGIYSQINYMGYLGGNGTWTDLTLKTGFLSLNQAGGFTTFTNPQITKAADGIVTIRGLLKTPATLPLQNGKPIDGQPIAEIPEQFCPDRYLLLPASDQNKTALLKISTSASPGAPCYVQTTIFFQTLDWLSLDGLNWRAK